MNISELRQTIHQEIDRLPEQALEQVFQLLQQVSPENNIDYAPIHTPEIKTQEIMDLANLGGSFNFLNDEPDLYTLEDGEPV